MPRAEPGAVAPRTTELRLAFFGTPAFACVHLEALICAGYRPLVVVTQPDRPRGRHGSPQPSPVKAVAKALGIEVWQPDNARKRAFVDRIVALKLDLLAVVAYGQLLPERLIEAPRLGTVNVHASLLPEYRGAAPMQWALLDGATRTGVTLQRVVRALDAGPVYARQALPIAPDDEIEALDAKLAQAGAALLIERLPNVLDGTCVPVPQDEARVTWARPIAKADGVIDWATDAAQTIVDRVRALHCWPGVAVTLPVRAGRAPSTLCLDRAVAAPRATRFEALPPGVLVDTSGAALWFTATGHSQLGVKELTPAGRRRMTAAQFLCGAAPPIGYDSVTGERLALPG